MPFAGNAETDVTAADPTLGTPGRAAKESGDPVTGVPRPGSRRFAATARTAPLAETGSRRGKPYAPEIVAEARRLFIQTELPTLIIASRLWVTPVTVARWAREGAWTRPRDLPEPDGSRSRRHRRRRRRVL